MEDLARQTGAAVVFPYYTPAPEAQYPVQFEQVYGVLEHFVANGDKYSIKTDQFGLAGDSVGGRSFITRAFSNTGLIYPQVTWLSR
jgi:acetyl esterase/lipase